MLRIEGGVEDRHLQRLKEARESPAVLKIRIAQIRSQRPSTPIFAFEGDDDKIVYARWISRIQGALSYEPFVCKGKREVRKLKDVLFRDLNGLSEGVYFFVDRDFDDLFGFVDSIGVFLTDKYSIENYLVSEEVLEKILRDEFPCHGHPAVRRRVIEVFSMIYEDFLDIVTEVNERIFLARRLNIEISEKIPSKIGKFAKVDLHSVNMSDFKIEDVVVMVREPSDKEAQELRKEFRSFDRRDRFRGKISYLF